MLKIFIQPYSFSPCPSPDCGRPALRSTKSTVLTNPRWGNYSPQRAQAHPLLPVCKAYLAEKALRGALEALATQPPGTSHCNSLESEQSSLLGIQVFIRPSTLPPRSYRLSFTSGPYLAYGKHVPSAPKHSGGWAVHLHSNPTLLCCQSRHPTSVQASVRQTSTCCVPQTIKPPVLEGEHSKMVGVDIRETPSTPTTWFKNSFQFPTTQFKNSSKFPSS